MYLFSDFSTIELCPNVVQGVFYWFRPKSSKCQSVSEFWHLELFDGIYYVILLGPVKKCTLYVQMRFLNKIGHSIQVCLLHFHQERRPPKNKQFSYYKKLHWIILEQRTAFGVWFTKKLHSEPNLLQWPRSPNRDITLPLRGAKCTQIYED